MTASSSEFSGDKFNGGSGGGIDASTQKKTSISK
jgi:hypothetical protein